MTELFSKAYRENMAKLYQAAHREEMLREFANAAPAEIPEWFLPPREATMEGLSRGQRYFRWRWHYAAAMVIEEEEARK